MNFSSWIIFLCFLVHIESTVWAFFSSNILLSRSLRSRYHHETNRVGIIPNMISSGFSFTDGEQILVSAQKPLGIVLEQDSETGIISVSEVDPTGSAGKGGVKVGDVLAAVQNASTENVDLDDVLAFIGNGPRVMNLRLIRAT